MKLMREMLAYWAIFFAVRVAWDLWTVEEKGALSAFCNLQAERQRAEREARAR